MHKLSGDEVETLIDSEMLRALNDRDVSEDVDEQTLCKAQLKAFADHMYITSEKYQQDARKLGIDPQSESFIAWSILNLRKENFFERRIGEPDIGKVVYHTSC